MSKLKYIKVYLHFDFVYFGIFLQVFFKHSMINESGQKIIKGWFCGENTFLVKISQRFLTFEWVLHELNIITFSLCYVLV